jgi:RNA polymerase sigma factor (sigma-70 family)
MTKTLADEEVMLQVREGTGEMLGVLFDRYQAPLFNFYAKLTGDRTLSEDLVQEVFMRILKYRQSYRPGTAFRPWIYQIARNTRVDFYRKQRPETPWEPEMSPAVVPIDSAQTNQETALLHRALMELPEEKREILVLCRFQELKYEEIARMLHCELGTVKVRIHRALQELRGIYQRMEGGQSGKTTNSEGTGGIRSRGASNEV